VYTLPSFEFTVKQKIHITEFKLRSYLVFCGLDSMAENNEHARMLPSVYGGSVPHLYTARAIHGRCRMPSMSSIM